MVIDFGHMKVVGRKVKAEKGSDMVFTFKGSPQAMAVALVKKHGKQEALRVVKALDTEDVFWKRTLAVLEKNA